MASRFNPKPKPKKHRKKRVNKFGTEARRIRYRSMSCLICGYTPCSPCHLTKSVGAGGDEDDIVPMCHTHHNEQHQHGITTFLTKYNITDKIVADERTRIEQVFTDEGI